MQPITRDVLFLPLRIVKSLSVKVALQGAVLVRLSYYKGYYILDIQCSTPCVLQCRTSGASSHLPSPSSTVVKDPTSGETYYNNNASG